MSTSRDPLYRRHRFRPEVISNAVWLYFRFPLSLRMVEEMLSERGIGVTYSIWHFDEARLNIHGQWPICGKRSTPMARF